METLWHDNKQHFRAVTGQNSNFPQSDGTVEVISFPVKGTVPIAKVLPGTIESTGVMVRGTDTTFLSGGKMKVGDFIYDGDAAVRCIKHIIHDELLELTQAFPSDISTAEDNCLVCERQAFKQIIYSCTHADNAAELQEAPLAVGDRAFNEGEPIAYDATGSEISFAVSR